MLKKCAVSILAMSVALSQVSVPVFAQIDFERPVLDMVAVDRVLENARGLPEIIHHVDRLARYSSNPVEIYLFAIDKFPQYRLSLMALAHATSVELPLLVDILDNDSGHTDSILSIESTRSIQRDPQAAEALRETWPGLDGRERFGRSVSTHAADGTMAPVPEAPIAEAPPYTSETNAYEFVDNDAHYSIPHLAQALPESMMVSGIDDDADAPGEIAVAEADDAPETGVFMENATQTLVSVGIVVAATAFVLQATRSTSRGSSDQSSRRLLQPELTLTGDDTARRIFAATSIDRPVRLESTITRLASAGPTGEDTVVSLALGQDAESVRVNLGFDRRSSARVFGPGSTSVFQGIGGNPMADLARGEDIQAFSARAPFASGLLRASGLSSSDGTVAVSFGYETKIDRVRVSADAGFVSEAGVLGYRPSASSDFDRGTTGFGSLSLAADLDETWEASVTGHLAFSAAESRQEAARLDARSSALSFDLTGRSVLSDGDTLTLSIATPLQIDSAKIRENSGQPFANILPAAREVGLSAQWSTPVDDVSSFVAGISHHFNAGQVSGRSDTTVALGFRLTF